MVKGPVVNASAVGWGTLIFALIGAFFYLVSTVLWKMGKNRYVSMVNPLICVATFAFYIMWVCAWLHQWHPLIEPELLG